MTTAADSKCTFLGFFAACSYKPILEGVLFLKHLARSRRKAPNTLGQTRLPHNHILQTHPVKCLHIPTHQPKQTRSCIRHNKNPAAKQRPGFSNLLCALPLFSKIILAARQELSPSCPYLLLSPQQMSSMQTLQFPAYRRHLPERSLRPLHPKDICKSRTSH